MPYDEVVKLRIRQSYRIAAEDNLVKWVKENYMDEVEWLFNVYHQGQEIKLKKENA